MATLVKDLVCGMEIDPETAAATSEYQGTTYYFCAVGCKQDFDADPEKYIAGAAPREMPAPAPASAQSAATASAGGKRWWEFWK